MNKKLVVTALLGSLALSAMAGSLVTVPTTLTDCKSSGPGITPTCTGQPANLSVASALPFTPGDYTFNSAVQPSLSNDGSISFSYIQNGHRLSLVNSPSSQSSAGPKVDVKATLSAPNSHWEKAAKYMPDDYYCTATSPAGCAFVWQ